MTLNYDIKSEIVAKALWMKIYYGNKFDIIEENIKCLRYILLTIIYLLVVSICKNDNKDDKT